MPTDARVSGHAESQQTKTRGVTLVLATGLDPRPLGHNCIPNTRSKKAVVTPRLPGTGLRRDRLPRLPWTADELDRLDGLRDNGASGKLGDEHSAQAAESARCLNEARDQCLVQSRVLEQANESCNSRARFAPGVRRVAKNAFFMWTNFQIDAKFGPQHPFVKQHLMVAPLFALTFHSSEGRGELVARSRRSLPALAHQRK
jgi:hypothetical protein